ncbi:hypothetical protein B0H14DRAFT_2360685, partial [Mycena olivaceomarginata]
QGTGACGDVYDDSSFTAAVSHLMYDAWPGANPTETNRNPICGPFVPGRTSIQVNIVDCCQNCTRHDIDLTPAAFTALADMRVGRTDVTWKFDNW